MNKELFERYPNPIFIETGSLHGNGIYHALNAGFKTIYSIELSPILYQECVDRYKDDSRVHLILGDSHLVMDELLSKINEQITFWLDGHYSGGDSVMGKYELPLIQELEAIGRHHIKTHTLIIDDLRCWSIPVQGFDTDMIIAKCLEINPDYSFIFEDGYIPKDILVAIL